MNPEIAAQIYAFNTHDEVDYLYYTSNLTGAAKEQYEIYPLNFTLNKYMEYPFVPKDRIEWKKRLWSSEDAESDDKSAISLRGMPKNVKHLVTYWGVKGEDIPEHIEKITLNYESSGMREIFTVPPHVKEIKFHHGYVGDADVDNIIIEAEHDVVVKAYIHPEYDWDSYRYVKGRSLKDSTILHIGVADSDDPVCDYSAHTHLEALSDYRSDMPLDRIYMFAPSIKEISIDYGPLSNKIDIRSYPALRSVTCCDGIFMLDNEGIGQLEELKVTRYTPDENIRFDLMTNIKKLSLSGDCESEVSITHIPSVNYVLEISKCCVHALPQDIKSLSVRSTIMAQMTLPDLTNLVSHDGAIFNKIKAPELAELTINMSWGDDKIMLPLLPTLSKLTISGILKSFTSPVQPNLMGCRFRYKQPDDALEQLFGEQKYKSFTAGERSIHVRLD
jgi:hypothetical protein